MEVGGAADLPDGGATAGRVQGEVWLRGVGEGVGGGVVVRVPHIERSDGETGLTTKGGGGGRGGGRRRGDRGKEKVRANGRRTLTTGGRG